jgi:hypothetical protein
MKRIATAVVVALSLGLWAPAVSAHDYVRYYYDRYGVRHRVVTHHRYRHAPRRVVVYRAYRPAVVRRGPSRFIPLPVPRRVPVPPPFRHF